MTQYAFDHTDFRVVDHDDVDEIRIIFDGFLYNDIDEEGRILTFDTGVHQSHHVTLPRDLLEEIVGRFMQRKLIHETEQMTGREFLYRGPITR